MKRFLALIIGFALLCTCALAFDGTGLTLDGEPATLAEIGAAVSLDYGEEFAPIYTAEAAYLWERGILIGSNNNLSLDKPLTRASGVVLVVRLLGAEEKAIAGQWVHPFTDVPDWAQPYVGYAYENGITKGVSDTLFHSDGPLTGQQYVTLVLRAMGYVDGVDVTYETGLSKALEVDLLDDALFALCTRSNLFVRDQVAAITYRALETALCRDGQLLRVKLGLKSVRTGPVPSMSGDDSGSSEPDEPEQPTIVVPSKTFSVSFRRQESTAGSRGSTDLTYDEQGGVVACQAYLVVEAGPYSGDLELAITVNGTTQTQTIAVTQGGTYQLVLTFQCRPVHDAAPIANKISVTANNARASLNVTCMAELSGATLALVS